MLAGLALLKQPGQEGQSRRNALLAAIRLKETEFNAEGLEMNQRYNSDAVLADADSAPEALPATRCFTSSRPPAPGPSCPTHG